MKYSPVLATKEERDTNEMRSSRDKQKATRSYGMK